MHRPLPDAPVPIQDEKPERPEVQIPALSDHAVGAHSVDIRSGALPAFDYRAWSASTDDEFRTRV